MIKAVIFDMDGTIVDNVSFHIKAFIGFIKSKGISITEKEYYSQIHGKINKEIIPKLFPKGLTPEESKKYASEKEARYRKLYKDVKPIEGLLNLFNEIKERNLKLALATSAPSENVDYVLGKLGIKNAFDAMVNGDEARKGKPNPEIYLKTAEKLGVEPKECLVFEDSIPGLQSAKAASMKVIAITTSHTPEELSAADGTIDDFTQVNIEEFLN